LQKSQRRRLAERFSGDTAIESVDIDSEKLWGASTRNAQLITKTSKANKNLSLYL
jgi:hypothetical protein